MSDNTCTHFLNHEEPFICETIAHLRIAAQESEAKLRASEERAGKAEAREAGLSGALKTLWDSVRAIVATKDRTMTEREQKRMALACDAAGTALSSPISRELEALREEHEAVRVLEARHDKDCFCEDHGGCCDCGLDALTSDMNKVEALRGGGKG